MIPHRGLTSLSTYFITAGTFQKKPLLQSDRMARLLLDVLQHYRTQGKFSLHEFVIMPDHFHLLLTPSITLERAMQLIKGGFSHRAKKELLFNGEIWQTSFVDRRVRDASEYSNFVQYIRENPVKKHLSFSASEFPYSSAACLSLLDDIPQRLKPLDFRAAFLQA
jgi:putative transposase